MLKIGIVAGEVSGDKLGAELIRGIQEKRSEVEVVGIGGEQLMACGCLSLFDMQRLAVVGIAEIFGRYFELLAVRRRLIKYFIDHPPDVFIGIDAPEFNLGLEKHLHRHGIKTIHYVSPSVWAWRRGRLNTIATAVDLMLVLFPFELRDYQQSGIPVCYVGHPLATFGLLEKFEKHEARRVLGVPQDKTIIALMPGSRQSELAHHAEIFLRTADRFARNHRAVYFVVNAVDENARGILDALHDRLCPALPMSIFVGDALRTMAASDLVLVSSGTATLEAMLLRKPMVVAYRVSWLTYWILRRLIRIPHIALPNLLAGRQLVPECLQDDCTADRLSRELSVWLSDDDKIRQLVGEFDRIHRAMLAEQRHSAADAVLALIDGEF